ncbi:MAG: hypothetical protein IJ093_02625 [Bacilli bacterium]|nr:hypothetical protein [Bacilli bacterium]
MNNKGFIASSLLYGMLALFLVIMLSTLSLLGNRKLSMDQMKKKALNDVADKKTMAEMLKGLEEESCGGQFVSDDTEQGRYIYRGSDPCNYISIYGTKYRIISVESDNTIKVISEESIPMVWDITEYSYGFDKAWHLPRQSSVEEDFCYVGSGTYAGCKSWGSKITTLDEVGEHVSKMYKSSKSQDTTYDLPADEAFVNIQLQNKILTDEMDSIVVNHVYNIGPVPSVEQTLSDDLLQESKYKWKGKVGLMYATDYVKANSNTSECGSLYAISCKKLADGTCASNYNNCYATNWLETGSAPAEGEWTMIPRSAGNIAYVWNTRNFANQQYTAAYESSGVRPVFYLMADIYYESGNGSIDDPYEFSI